jgi:hypothetical protein
MLRLRASLRRKKGIFDGLLFHGFGRAVLPPIMPYRGAMYDFAKKFFARLRDFGCPDTLLKDVRDVAAAVCAARGRDGRKES